ncbi:Papilin-like protein 1 [Sarcoptes scabiei]|uniref:Papilin-like protein 1 n=1 Tax=Sarcoptes scabiei TaxID=52283 RepID=A0A132AHY5_SARSC|nr:Papilin-like protein 1 [Sarcoptes scabiei]
MPNNSLIIDQIDSDDTGFYICRATNEEYDERSNIEVILESVNKNNEAEIIPYDPMRHNPNGDSVRVLMPDNGFDNNFEKSIFTEIDFWPKDYRVGSTIHLDCLVRSQRTGQIIPSADVIWYVNSDIPLSVDETNHHHYMIMPNNTLLIHRLARGDSGVYRCRATTGPISDSYSSIQLQVENIHVPADCQNNPIFQNCVQIVQNNYCRNPHYRRFCCRSCYIAEHIMFESLCKYAIISHINTI